MHLLPSRKLFTIYMFKKRDVCSCMNYPLRLSLAKVCTKDVFLNGLFPQESRSPPSASDSSQPQHKCEFEAEVVRAMAQGTSKTRAKVQEVESALGVTVLVRLPRRGDTSKTAAVVVKGSDPEACKKACADLEKAFKDFSSQAVECDRAKASRILRGAAVDFSHIE